MASLKALNASQIDTWYLYAPDRNTPFEDTLREVNNLYKEGYFLRFGIGNFMSWEVAQICEICEKNGWIKPSVYQGLYNALHRAIEPELVPCLRHYGIVLEGVQPLASGLLTSRYRRDMAESEHESSSALTLSACSAIINEIAAGTTPALMLSTLSVELLINTDSLKQSVP